jgi:hypothetical protein
MKAKIKKNKNVSNFIEKRNASNGKEFDFEATPADIVTGKYARESNYYKPNQHYPQKLCGGCLMDMAIKVQQYMMELLNDDGSVGIEEITALRSLDAIVHERTKEIVEDFAKDLADDYDTKPYEKKPKFGVGDVVRFDAKEYDGNRKYGVIVEAYEEDGETKYSVYLGHNTLSGITEPILYDMLGIEKYKK